MGKQQRLTLRTASQAQGAERTIALWFFLARRLMRMQSVPIPPPPHLTRELCDVESSHQMKEAFVVLAAT